MKWILPFVIVGLLVNPVFAGWWPFSVDNENVQINVYFYYPNGKEVYLGEVKGVSQCQKTASSFAYIEKQKQSNWDYLCCTIRKGSSCYEKIR